MFAYFASVYKGQANGFVIFIFIGEEKSYRFTNYVFLLAHSYALFTH